MKHPKAFVIDCGAWPDQITVFVNMDKGHATKYMRKEHFNPRLVEAVLEYTSFWEKNIPKTLHLTNESIIKDAFFMYLPNIDYQKKGSVKKYLNTLVHEATHAADFILRLRGAETEQEARAYLTEHIFRQILEHL